VKLSVGWGCWWGYGMGFIGAELMSGIEKFSIKNQFMMTGGVGDDEGNNWKKLRVNEFVGSFDDF
jgi:hypothetical protein